MDSLDVAKVRKLNMCGVCVGGMLTAWMGRGRGGESFHEREGGDYHL